MNTLKGKPEGGGCVMVVSRCTSWLGHKFEGRYSSDPVPFDGDRKIDVQGAAAIDAIKRMNATVTYERDICVRCGVTVEKNAATQTAETQAKPTL